MGDADRTISEQLRDYADEKVWEKETKPWARTVPDYLLRGAADEIERLRAELEQADSTIAYLRNMEIPYGR